MTDVMPSWVELKYKILWLLERYKDAFEDDADTILLMDMGVTGEEAAKMIEAAIMTGTPIDYDAIPDPDAKSADADEASDQSEQRRSA